MEALLGTDDFVPFASRQCMFNEIMEALKDENINVIGICGMGGIGKTKLVLEIGKKAKHEGLFDTVVMTVASKDPDIRRIQGILADMLSLAFKGTSEVDRATELLKILKKKKRVLIILDDVWEKLDLADIGIPCGLDNMGCKLVLTTRRTQVCDDMHCQRKVHLNVLNDDEALYLFSKHARIRDANFQRHSKAKEVVKECAGLPLAIETVGSALRNKSLVDYDVAIRKLSRSDYVGIESVDKEIYPAIKLSIDYLKCETSVRCLTLFSLYPEDSTIKLEDFTRIAFGLGLFGNVKSVEAARQNTLRCVTRLLGACLLLPSKGTLKSSNSFQQTYETWNTALVIAEGCIPSVKVHDIVRDVALWLSRKDKFFYMQKSPTKKQSLEYDDANAISMRGCGLACLHDRLKCQNLKLLLAVTDILESQDDCFKMMSALQVLKLRTVCEFSSFPVSIQHLHNLRTFLFIDAIGRWLGSWCSAERLSVIGRLKKLQILRLASRAIRELPQEMEELTGLRLLDLSLCLGLKKIPGDVLSSLTALEELYICGDFVVEKDLLSEITSLPHLTALTARVNWAGVLPTLGFRKPLQRYKIYSGGFRHQYSRNVSIDVLDCSRMAFLQQLFPLVKEFYIGRLQDTFENLLPECFQDLINLVLEDCDVDCLIDTTTTTCQPMRLFSNLQNLKLTKATKMTRLFRGPPPPGCFTNLRKVHMDDCSGRFENIVPYVIPIGPKLESLLVLRCERLKHIFELDLQDNLRSETSLLPCPPEIHLQKLPELRGIWKPPHQWDTLHLTNNDNHDEFHNLILEAMLRSFNSLVTVAMYECEKVEEAFRVIDYNDQIYKEQFSNLREICFSKLCQLRCIWKGPHQNLHLHKLECIHIYGCDKLTSIFTTASAKSLHKLSSIRISNCGALESIIALDKDEFSTSADSSLTLTGLPELETIVISSCGELKSIFPVSVVVVAQGLLKLRHFSISDCAKLGQVFGDGEGTLTSTDEITMKNLQSLIFIWPSLQQLRMKRCPLIGKTFGLAHRKEQKWEIVPTARPQSWASLQHLELGQLDKVEELFDFSGGDVDQMQQPFRSPLKELHLESLTALNHIWKGSIHSVQLHYLKHLHVEKCPNLRTLLTPVIADALPQLENIKIEYCQNLETVIGMVDHEGQASDQLDFSERALFPKLEKIDIEGCKQMKSVLAFCVAQELPQLRILKIKNCPVLEEVFSVDEGEHNEDAKLNEIKLPNSPSLTIDNVQRFTLLTSANLPVSCPRLTQVFLGGEHTTLGFPDTTPPVDPWEESQMQNCRMFGARGFGAVSDHFGFEKLVVKNCEVEELFDLELIIGGSNQEPVSIEITTLLCLSHLPDLKCIWKGPPNLISWIHLGDIEVGNCASLKKSLFTQSIAQKLSGLRTLYVYNCEELEYIVGPKDYSLQDEEQSCSFSDTCLSLLRKIKVEDCGSLKFVFPLSVAQGLPSLEEITINGACRLEQVIGDDRTNERATDKEILFPQLRILKLQDLPCLRRMVPAGYSLSSSSVVKVKEVFIKNCSIEELFDLREEIDTLSHEKRQQMSHSSTGAHTGLLNLQKIEVEECSNLRTLFNTIVAGALPKLNLITIKNCQNLETILAMGDGHSAHDYDLVERTCMPELRQIYIEGCHKLKSVFPLSVGQKLTQLTSCRIIDCPILGEHLTPIKESTGNIATRQRRALGILQHIYF